MTTGHFIVIFQVGLFLSNEFANVLISNKVLSENADHFLRKSSENNVARFNQLTTVSQDVTKINNLSLSDNPRSSGQ